MCVQVYVTPHNCRGSTIRENKRSSHSMWTMLWWARDLETKDITLSFSQSQVPFLQCTQCPHESPHLQCICFSGWYLQYTQHSIPVREMFRLFYLHLVGIQNLFFFLIDSQHSVHTNVLALHKWHIIIKTQESPLN